MNQTISTRNKKIVQFYQNNPSLNFEQMNLIFIDILEKLGTNFQQTKNDNTNSLLKEICSSVQSLQKDQLSLQENHKSLLNQYLLQTHQTIQKNNQTIKDQTALVISEQMPQLRNNLKEDIHNQNQKPTIQIQQILLNHQEKISSILDSKVSSRENENNSKIWAILQEQQDSFKEIKQFLDKQKICNSSITGKEGENRLERVLNESFPQATIHNTTGNSESADFILQRENHSVQNILIENKEYSSNVPIREVKKFIRDVECKKMHGIFFSQTSGISSKKNFELNLHASNIILFIHNCNYNPYIIQTSVQIIDSISEKIDFEKLKEISINQDELSSIQSEFMNFITQRNSLIELTKKFSRETLQTLDSMEIPTLSKILSVHYSNIGQDQSLVCNTCGLIFKNKRSLGSHKKGCKGKNESVIQINS